MRNLTFYLRRGGTLQDVRLVEAEDGDWTMWLRLAGQTGEHRLNIDDTEAPRLYRVVGHAIAACRDEFRYFGPITLSTEKRPKGAVAEAAKAAAAARRSRRPREPPDKC